MKRLAVLGLAGVLVAAAAVAVWVAIGGAPWEGSSGFCRGASVWREAQEPFLLRVNEPGSREDYGLPETHEVFYEAAKVLLPVTHSGAEKQARAVMRDVVRVEEEWLSSLATMNAITSPEAETTSDQRIDAIRSAEAKRLELNDLLRESNSQLDDTCGLPPLPLYE